MDQVLQVVRSMCTRVSSPVSATVLRMAEAGEWIELQKLNIVPTDYENPFAYWADASCVDLVRKMAIAGGNTGRAAVDKFLETERDCYRVNQRMRTIVGNYGLTVTDLAFIDLLDRWKEKIRTVLGRLPEYLEPSFSGGSTTSTTRLESTIYDKLSMTPQRYAHSTDVVDYLFYATRWGDIAHERGLYPTTVRANTYFTVPKNGQTDRSCGMEAGVNLSFQLAVGKVMRKRAFKMLNIDLDHGAELHRLQAWKGSLDGSIATLDLSSASDRWARDLVRYLLPEEWRILLDSLRATHTNFGGRLLYLEKFSSMGNGFTFELESILFSTLALTVQAQVGLEGDVLCYGDDLIVSPELAPHLIVALTSVGHQLNLKKSFTEGPFRESCGGDYHSGEAVSTAKLEKVPEEPSDWISFANNLRRVAGGRRDYWALVRPAWKLALSFLPRHIAQLTGPETLGDQVIHTDGPWPFSVNGQIRVWAPVVTQRNLGLYWETPLAIVLGKLKTGPGPFTVALRQVEGYRVRTISPAMGCTWLPTDHFRVVDPRLTSVQRLHAAAQCLSGC